MSEIIEGYVDRIRFRNEENGYTVLGLEVLGEEEICVGFFNYIAEGEYIQAEGEYIEHATYGIQFQISKFEVKVPEDINGMERYLGSGALKGIGAVLAKRIVKKFKLDTFRIIEEEPERLAEIKGITEKKAREIAIQFVEKQDIRQAMLFLGQYGISNNFAVKIYNKYGNDLYDIIQSNPYQLADDITGIGFQKADEIAHQIGIGLNSKFRICSGILYVLTQANIAGHIYLPKEILIRNVKTLLKIELDTIEDCLVQLSIEKKIVLKKMEEEIIYSYHYYCLELKAAKSLMELNLDYDVEEKEIEKETSQIELLSQIQLDDTQQHAIRQAARSGVFILTGGPGTGKTTTINAIIQYFELQGLDIMLGAPTGRAAKRMTEATGCKAQTIHRLLELNGGIEETKRYSFQRNEQNPLETDVVIIDEMSMVDISLFQALLRAIIPGTRLILVGDINQLPSVGAGNVLKDIIASGKFSVVKLTQIFRQEKQSNIVINAHKINCGQKIELTNKNQDFLFLKRENSNDILGVLIYLIRDKLPSVVRASTFDIQVLTPMRKGELGVENLNKVLQQYLNPVDSTKREYETRHGIFREGDKVMQIKNNYQLEWMIKNDKGFTLEEGLGVFNGDIGRIEHIYEANEEMKVIFDENKEVMYSLRNLDELELAYAITIHKSQGSEYPAVLLPILTGPRILFNRNLLYTAVTRAKQCVTVIGNDYMIDYMVQNADEQKRYTSLALRIQELSENI